MRRGDEGKARKCGRKEVHLMMPSHTHMLHGGKGVQEVMSHGRLHIGKTDRQTVAIKPDIKSAHGNRQEDTVKVMCVHADVCMLFHY